MVEQEYSHAVPQETVESSLDDQILGIRSAVLGYLSFNGADNQFNIEYRGENENIWLLNIRPNDPSQDFAQISLGAPVKKDGKLFAVIHFPATLKNSGKDDSDNDFGPIALEGLDAIGPIKKALSPIYEGRPKIRVNDPA